MLARWAHVEVVYKLLLYVLKEPALYSSFIPGFHLFAVGSSPLGP